MNRGGFPELNLNLIGDVVPVWNDLWATHAEALILKTDRVLVGIKAGLWCENRCNNHGEAVNEGEFNRDRMPIGL